MAAFSDPLVSLLKTRRGALAAAGAMVAVLVLVGAGALVWLMPSAGSVSPAPATGTPAMSLDASATPSATPSYTVPSGPIDSYAELDGMPSSSAAAHRLAMAIMVDDQPSARPQAGFTAASIVWQGPADGGQTRYMMVFQEQDAIQIGPVRSGRPYFLRWATEYRGVFGHYGGDNETLYVVAPQLKRDFWDMDGLTGRGACAYHRVSTRPMPHNAYTNTADLYRCAASLGYPEVFSPQAGKYTFVEDSPSDSLPKVAWILVAYRGVDVRYDFNPTTADYVRSVDGKPHLDAANGQQVRARNVAVLFQKLTTYAEPGHVRPVLASVGSGEAWIFREGRLVKGKWQKKDDTALTRLYDSSGVEIPFVRGQIYMQVVPIGTKVAYKAG